MGPYCDLQEAPPVYEDFEPPFEGAAANIIAFPLNPKMLAASRFKR